MIGARTLKEHMELFKDKTFEEMDEISQMIEPYEFKLNEELSQFPDEFEMSQEFVTNLIDYNYRRLAYDYAIQEDLRSIVSRKASDLGLKILADKARLDHKFILEFFDLDVSEDASFNANTNTLTGVIKIIKKKIAYDDKDIERLMKEHIELKFNNEFYFSSDVDKGRINEILDLFGVTDGLSERKGLIKVEKLKKHYIQLIEDRSLIIKDMDLLKRFVDWNIKYVKDGSLPAFSNITKIKIMMRKGQPIYSIKEDVT